MSEYGFGEELTEQQSQGGAAPKWFRERMDEVSETLKELRAENDRLKAEQAQQAVKTKLTAQGYAPEVANLYTGKPEGLDDWLSTNGVLFAKAAQAEGEQQAQTQQGPPPTVVSPESQAAAARFAAAGENGAAPLAGDDQLAARIAAAQTPEELAAIYRDNGSKFF